MDFFRSATPAEEAEVHAIIRREHRKIEKAVMHMVKGLRGLSDVSQIQALAVLVSGYIKEVCPDDETARVLSDHMHKQIEIYLGSKPAN